MSMFLVHKAAADTARARIQVLVWTPNGKVNIPVVHTEFDIAYIRHGNIVHVNNILRRRVQGHAFEAHERLTNGVGQVPPHDAAFAVGGFGYLLDLKGLSGEELHAGEQHQCDGVPFLLDVWDDVLRTQIGLTLSHLQLYQGFFEIVPV